MVEMFAELEQGVRQVRAYELDEAFFDEFR